MFTFLKPTDHETSMLKALFSKEMIDSEQHVTFENNKYKHMKLNAKEYNPYYQSFISKAASGSIVDGLASNYTSVPDFYKGIPEHKLDYAYAEGKWTIKDILIHLIDTERVFSYRAMRIARQDKTEMAGFEQDNYVTVSNTKERSIDDLINEYKAVRNATIALFKSFREDELTFIGSASGSPVSVRAIGYIITGHENHHNNVIKERYL
jgi:hypothetical protein